MIAVYFEEIAQNSHLDRRRALPGWNRFCLFPLFLFDKEHHVLHLLCSFIPIYHAVRHAAIVSLDS